MSNPKHESIPSHEQTLHADKIDLQDMVKAIFFLPNKTNPHETRSIQPVHKEGDKQDKSRKE
jgi:hypothetical protein